MATPIQNRGGACLNRTSCMTRSRLLACYLVEHGWKSSSINADPPAKPQQRQAPGHADTIFDDIQLGADDLPPADGDLDDGDAGKLGEHEHLDVEDPAVHVHVRDDVRQGGPREQLEAALGVADARRRRRRHQLQQQVERVHQEVAQPAALHHRRAAHQVRPRPHRHGAAPRVLRLLARRHQLAQVRDVAGPVRVREHHVLPPRVPHPVRHCPAFAAVWGEGHHAYRPWWDLHGRLGPVCPWPRGPPWVFREDVHA